MMFLIFLIVGIGAFYIRFYRTWNYNKKFLFKTILFYLELGLTALMLWATIVTVEDVAETEQDKQIPSRLDSMEHAAENNDYGWMADFMERDRNYEEEFEYFWERIVMYESSLRYRIYVAADEAGLGEEFAQKADEYETLVLEHCKSPVYAQNVPYGEYFLDLIENE